MSSHSTTIRRESGAGDVVTLWLVPPVPGKPPTLDHQTLDELDATLAHLETATPTVRAVVIRSENPRHFCVGANLHALRTVGPDTIETWIRHGHAVFNRLSALPQPVIALIEGNALGGGLELALAADLLIAGPGAHLGQPEATLGFVAGWGGPHRLVGRVGAAQARELLLTRRILDADMAARLGLVDLAPADPVHALADLLTTLLAGSAVAHAGHKRLVAHATGHRPDHIGQVVAESIACVQATDTQDRLAAFFAARAKP